MSDGELSRLEVLRDLDQRLLTTAAAARTRAAQHQSTAPPRSARRALFKVG
jgi:hypothetical protein